jgi:putative ABC transport system ATP-binding protein
MKPTGKPLLLLEGVAKTFFTDKVQTNALSDINLEIFEGEFVTIAGPSGCGKSTLLSILGLLDSPTQGRHFINQTAVEKLDHAALARIRNAEIGFVFQDFNLIGDMTVFENVELPLTHRNMARKDRHSRVMECLETVGMTARAEHYPSQLSGGQQQRVAVAVALANSPEVLLADEPTGELDEANSEMVLEAFRGINETLGTTVLIVTHDAGVSDHVRRTVQIRDGRTSTEVLRRTSTDHTGREHEVAEEFAVLDRVGRLQLPQDYITQLAMRDRVRLGLEDDHVTVSPVRSAAAANDERSQAESAEEQA